MRLGVAEMVGPWFLQIVPHRLWFTAVAWNYADAIRRSPTSVRYAVGLAVGVLGVLARSRDSVLGNRCPASDVLPRRTFRCGARRIWSRHTCNAGPCRCSCVSFSGSDPSVSWRSYRRNLHLGPIHRAWYLISLCVELLIRARTTAQHASQKAHEARIEAELANAAKDKFLAMVSHELRVPLQAILAGVQVLRNKSHLPSELEPIVNVIERNARIE